MRSASRGAARIASRIGSICALLPLLLVAGGCQTVQTTRGGAVGVERQQQMSSLVPASDVEAAARKQYAQIVNDARAKGLLDRDPEITGRVQRVAHRLIPNTAAFRDDAPGWAGKWRAGAEAISC